MPGPPPLGAEQDVLGLIHNLDEKRLAVYKKKAELDVKERLRAAEAFKARVKEEAEREQLDFVARFRPGKGHSQRNVEDSVSLVKLQAGKIAAAEKARLAKLSAKEQRDLLNAETARLKLEEVVERKRAMLEERFERLNHARENEERRQAEKRAEWMEKERKREEATREAKRAAAENWQKRKVEHQTQIEAHKQAWYNKLTTTEKEVQSRMSEKFSREQERLKAQEAAREAELRERRKALEQHHTQKRMAYEQRCAQEQQRRNELDAAWARKLQELEDLDNEVKRMLNERSMANAEYWEYCQNLVAQARKHDKLFRESLSGILDGRGERAHEMQKRRAMLQNRIQLLNHNLAVSKEDLANMVEVAWSPMPDVKVEPPPPLPEFKVKKRGPTAAEAAAAEMAAQEQKRREAELDKLADSGQYHEGADVSVPRPKRFSRYSRPNTAAKAEFAKTL